MESDSEVSAQVEAATEHLLSCIPAEVFVVSLHPPLGPYSPDHLKLVAAAEAHGRARHGACKERERETWGEGACGGQDLDLALGAR